MGAEGAGVARSYDGCDGLKEIKRNPGFRVYGLVPRNNANVVRQ